MEATGDTHEQLAKHGREGGETDAKYNAPEGEDRQRRVVLEGHQPRRVVARALCGSSGRALRGEQIRCVDSRYSRLCAQQ